MQMCHQCGAPLVPNAKYCRSCGALQTPKPAPKPDAEAGPQSPPEGLPACDCCGAPFLSQRDLRSRFINKTPFQLCTDCAYHVDQLNQRFFLSTKERNNETAWATAQLNRNLNPNKRAAFATLLDGKAGNGPTGFSNADPSHAAPYGNSAPQAAGSGGTAAPVYEPPGDYGSPWTVVAKISCFFLVLGAMIGGGVLGHTLSFGSDDGGGILLGGFLGLIAGLIVVSGIMMLVTIADDVKDSKRYLKGIYSLMKQANDEKQAHDPNPNKDA